MKFQISNPKFQIPNFKTQNPRWIRRIQTVVLVVFIFAVVSVVFFNLRDRNQLIVEYHFKDDARIFGLYPSDRVSQKYTCSSVVIARSKATKQSPSIARDNGIDNARASPMTNDCKFQEIVASPVYFDIRYWQNFRKAKVEILYEKDPEVDFQIGYKVGKDFQWKLFPIESEQNRHFDRSESDERSGEISKDSGRGYEDLPRRSESKAGISRLRSASLEMTLNGEFISYNNIHRWVLSSSNVQDLGKAIRIYGIKFTFTK